MYLIPINNGLPVLRAESKSGVAGDALALPQSVKLHDYGGMVARSGTVQAHAGQSRAAVTFDLLGKSLTQYAGQRVSPPIGQMPSCNHIIGSRVPPGSWFIVRPAFRFWQPFDKVHRQICHKRSYRSFAVITDFRLVEIADHKPKCASIIVESSFNQALYGQGFEAAD
jgi:hypothetical protein